jgi:hypothetical protein
MTEERGELGMSRTGEPQGPGRVRDRLSQLVEWHGDDYLEEGKKLLRRTRLTVTIVGIVVAVVAVAILVLIPYAALR